jgi:hypothetical protein
MVVPDELKEAKSQFRVLKDNQYLMPVLNHRKTLNGNNYISFNYFSFDGQSETLKQTGNEVGFSKKLKRSKIPICYWRNLYIQRFYGSSK